MLSESTMAAASALDNSRIGVKIRNVNSLF